MAKDTLTLRPVLSIAEGLTVTADFQTIQSARRILNDERQKIILTLRLQDAADVAQKMSLWTQKSLTVQ